ncbi:MAG: hypothetical protein ABSF50_11735 [Burkholderiaceae bacterium]|jgi:hypothetical protein
MICPSAPHEDAPLLVWSAWLQYLKNLPGWSPSLERDIQYAMKVVQEKDEAKLAQSQPHSHTSTEAGLDAQ